MCSLILDRVRKPYTRLNAFDGLISFYTIILRLRSRTYIRFSAETFLKSDINNCPRISSFTSVTRTLSGTLSRTADIP